jgi:hypothetical protein
LRIELLPSVTSFTLVIVFAIIATGCGFPALPGWASTNDQAKTWDCRVNTMLV